MLFTPSKRLAPDSGFYTHWRRLSYIDAYYSVLWTGPTNTELVMLERTQLAILKSILHVGLPMRTKSLAIHLLLGTLPISTTLLRILCLDESLAKRVLLFRLCNPIRKILVCGLLWVAGRTLYALHWGPRPVSISSFQKMLETISICITPHNR